MPASRCPDAAPKAPLSGSVPECAPSPSALLSGVADSPIRCCQGRLPGCLRRRWEWSERRPLCYDFSADAPEGTNAPSQLAHSTVPRSER